MRAHWHELPFDAQSIDLILLPHALEFIDNPHEVLREVDRVLRPEGRVLILGFNPWSLFGLRRVWSGADARSVAAASNVRSGMPSNAFCSGCTTKGNE